MTEKFSLEELSRDLECIKGDSSSLYSIWNDPNTSKFIGGCILFQRTTKEVGGVELVYYHILTSGFEKEVKYSYKLCIARYKTVSEEIRKTMGISNKDWIRARSENLWFDAVHSTLERESKSFS